MDVCKPSSTKCYSSATPNSVAKEVIVAVTVETGRQSVAPENVIVPAAAGLVAEREGSYRSESVKPTPENSVLTKAAESEGALATPVTDLRGLAQRVTEGPAVATTALYETLAGMPELENTALPQMFEFLDALAELAGDEAGEEAGKTTEEGEGHEVGGEGLSEQETPEGEGADRVRTVGDREGGGTGGDTEGGDRGEGDLESGIHQALAKFGNNNTDKAAALDLARGFFETRDANLNFLNVLSALSGEFLEIVPESPLAQLAAAQEALLAAATLESSPAAVRKRYRKKLREKRNLGELFEELTKLGLESNFPTLFAEVGADLAGVGSQSDRNYLRSLTAELKKLWQLKSAHEETKELVRITEPHLSQQNQKPEPLKLTTSFLYYCGKPIVSPGDAQSLLDLVVGASPGSQVVFAIALRDLHARMPDGIWLTSRERMLQYTALGALCHRLTEAEERFYEETDNT
jgi:hypothetical protein